AAQADAHARPAELDQQAARRQRVLADMAGVDRADSAGDHDRLVISAPRAVDVLFVAAEVAEQVRPAELVVEGGAADRAVDHDVERRCDMSGTSIRPGRFASVDFPGLFEARNAQVRYGEAGQAKARPRPAASGALVADLPARPGCRAGK